MIQLFKIPLLLQQLGIVLFEGSEDFVDVVVGLRNVAEERDEGFLQLGVSLSQFLEQLLLEEEFGLLLEKDVVEVVCETGVMFETFLAGLNCSFVILDHVEVVDELDEDLDHGEVHFHSLHHVLVGVLDHILLGTFHDSDGTLEKRGYREVALLAQALGLL